MKKLVLSAILGVALVGCGGVESPESTQEIILHGRSITLSITHEAESPDRPYKALAPPGGGAPQDACKVTLTECPTPDTNVAVCNATLGCIDPTDVYELCKRAAELGC